jgi:hypothetical protein
MLSLERRFSWIRVHRCVDFVYLKKISKNVAKSKFVFKCKIGVDTAETEPSKVSSIIPTQAILFHIDTPPSQAPDGCFHNGFAPRLQVCISLRSLL